MIYKKMEEFLKRFIENQVTENIDSFKLNLEIPEIVTYFRLLYINSGQGAFYNILSNYINSDSGLYELLKKCYQLHLDGKLIDKETTITCIVQSIFSNTFLKKFDKEAKVALPPIVGILFYECYKDITTNNWLTEIRAANIEISTPKYAALLNTACQKKLEKEGMMLCEDLITIREATHGTFSEDMKSSYMLMIDYHSRYKDYDAVRRNCEKIIRIEEKSKNLDSFEMIECCGRVADIYEKNKQYIKAISYYEKSLKCSILREGENSVSVAKLYQKIGSIYSATNEFKKAVPNFQNAGEIYEKEFSIENDETIQIYKELINNEVLSGEYEKALNSLNKIMDVIIHKNGNKSSEALEMKVKKATICMHLNMFEEMDHFFSESIAIIDSVFEGKHHLLGTIKCTYGDIEFAKKNYKQAIALYNEAYDIYKNTASKDSSEKNSVYTKIGLCYEKTKDYETAQTYYEDNISMLDPAASSQYLAIISLKERVGNILRIKKEFDKSKALLLEVKFAKEENYPEKHIERESIYYNLGLLFKDICEYSQSLESFDSALKTAKRLFADDHEFVLSIYYQLAIVNGHLGKVDDATKYYLEVIDKQEANGNPMEVANLLKDLASLYFDYDRFDEALIYADKALEVTIDAVGKEDVAIISCINLQGKILNELGEIEKSLEKFEMVVQIIKSKFGTNNHNLAIAYENLSDVQVKFENYDAVITLLQDAIRINIRNFGEKSVAVGHSYSNLAFIYYLQKNYKDALLNYEKVIGIDEMKQEDSAIITPEIYYALGNLYMQQGNQKKALEYYILLSKLAESVENNTDEEIETNNLIKESYRLESTQNFEQALKLFQDFMVEKTEKYGKESLKNGIIYRKIAKLYDKTNQIDAAIFFANKSILFRKYFFGEFASELIDDYIDLAAYYGEKGEFELALDCFEKASYIIKKNPVGNELQIGKLYLESAAIHVGMNEYNFAFEKFDEAIHVFKNPDTGNAVCLWQALNKKGIAKMTMDSDEEALNCFRKGEQLCYNNEEIDDAHLANSFTNLGHIYLKMELYDDAFRYYEHALKFRLDMDGEDSFFVGYLYHKLGETYKITENFQKAYENLELSKKAYKNSIGENHNNYKFLLLELEEVRTMLDSELTNTKSRKHKILELIKGV